MKTFFSCLLIGLALFAGICQAAAQSSAFTYQGQLIDGTSIANGFYDLRFKLYDASSAGAQLGSLLTNSATPVSNGLFTVTLDFGNQFPGANRWLEIDVRTNGNGTFNTLSPRQAVTPAPYAIYSANAGTAVTAASANSVFAANVVGTIPLAQLPPGVVTNGASGVGGTNLRFSCVCMKARIFSNRTFQPLTKTVSLGCANFPEHLVVIASFLIHFGGDYVFVFLVGNAAFWPWLAFRPLGGGNQRPINPAIVQSVIVNNA